MSKQFYIQDKRQIVGNCLVFWRHEGHGYTTSLVDAWVVDESWKPWRNTDVLWPKEEIDSIAQLTVDHQRLNRIKEVK